MELHVRSALKFVVMENVPELATARYRDTLRPQIEALEKANFVCGQAVLNAKNYGVPQSRRRLFLVALNKDIYGERRWGEPPPSDEIFDVRSAISALPSPAFFSRDIRAADIPHHPNHWCMMPKSKKFGTPLLAAGTSFGRSFKTLDWSRPSLTVSYGHREVHVHPDGTRRLSVYEAMLLQGFPESFVLEGNLSAQITQVSEAVPPPLALAIANSIQAMPVLEAPR